MIRRLIDIFAGCNAESLSIIVNEQMTAVRAYLEEIAPTLPFDFHLVVKSTPSSMHSFYEVSRVFDGGGKFILTTVDTIFREPEFKAYAAAFEADDSADGCFAVTSFIDDETKKLITNGLPSLFNLDVSTVLPLISFNWIEGNCANDVSPANANDIAHNSFFILN